MRVISSVSVPPADLTSTMQKKHLLVTYQNREAEREGYDDVESSA
jgi:hypothetical protein